jgi:hypothetical protein
MREAYRSNGIALESCLVTVMPVVRLGAVPAVHQQMDSTHDAYRLATRNRTRSSACVPNVGVNESARGERGVGKFFRLP